MRGRFLQLLLLVGTATSTPVSTLKRQTESSGTSHNERTGLLNALNQANLTTLSSFFSTYPAVLQQVTDSPGLKTILAPTNDAVADIPAYCKTNSTCFENTMLMHILNGSFNVNLLEFDPTHTVGHSFLTDSHYATLPGSNGQAVALSLATNREATSIRRSDATASSINVSQGTNFATIQEALNVDHFVPIQAIQAGKFTIQPVSRAMTIPGDALGTLRICGNFSRFIKQIDSQGSTFASTLNSMRGLTIFAPNDEAWTRYEESNNNFTGSNLTALLLNHFVANRAVYSPLLKGQGSMVTMAGQDLAFDSDVNSVIIGNYSANVTQFDIMHRGGVIHTIDAVLTDSNVNTQRASQAAISALNSAISGIAGPVSYQNAASSQGDTVPASITATNGQRNANNSITMQEIDGGGSGSGSSNTSSGTQSPPTSSKSNDAERTTIQGPALLAIATLFAFALSC